MRRPSPALVVASLALLVALTGTSVAAVTLAKNSVGTVQLRQGAVTSPKVKDGSLGVVDLSRGARLALTGAVGPQGPAGPKGDKGDNGDPAPRGVGGLEWVYASSAFDSLHEKSALVVCPTDKKLVGGGAGAWGRAMIYSAAGVALTASHPVDDRSWYARAREVNATDEGWFVRVHAICVDAP